MHKVLLHSLSFLLLTAAAPQEATRITSQADAARLGRAKGVTLQWIDWNTRGSVRVQRGRLWHLTASQAQAGGPGRLVMDGDVTEIGPGYFTFRGSIRIRHAGRVSPVRGEQGLALRNHARSAVLPPARVRVVRRVD